MRRFTVLTMSLMACAAAPAFAQHDIVIMRKPMHDTFGDPTKIGIAVWQADDWGPYSTTCGMATQAREVRCVNGEGATIDARICNSAQRPEGTQSIIVTSGCTYEWRTGGWSPVSACGPAVHSRTVQCVRSDGTELSDEACVPTAGPVPDRSETIVDYGSCTYDWTTGGWSDYSSSCSSSATRTRTVTCLRSDQKGVPDAQCDPLRKPAPSETASVYSGCTYSWQPTYGAWDNTCASNARRTVSWTCTRSDGTPATSDTQCGTKPPTTETGMVQTGCSLVVTNPGFEDGNGWTVSGSSYTTAEKHSGLRSMIVGSYNQNNPTQSLPGLHRGSNYKLSFWAKGGGTIYPRIYQGQGITGPAFTAVTTDQWQYYEGTFTSLAPDGLGFVNFYKDLLNQPTTYIDDVSVIPIP